MRLTVRVAPRARQRRLEQAPDGTWRAMVPEPPEDGRANAALVALLAEHFNVPKRALRIVHGYTSRQKIVEIKSLISALAAFAVVC